MCLSKTVHQDNVKIALLDFKMLTYSISPLLNGGSSMSFPAHPLTPPDLTPVKTAGPPALIPLLEPTPNEPSKFSPRIKSAIIKQNQRRNLCFDHKLVHM